MSRSIKAILIRPAMWSDRSIKLLHSYPNLMYGNMSNAYCFNGAVSAINRFTGGGYTPEQFLVIDQDLNFLDDCHTKGANVVQVDKRCFWRSVYCFPRRLKIPNLMFLPMLLILLIE